jgi:predicted oxidoreductase (fatty acid repression mutant protein)
MQQEQIPPGLTSVIEHMGKPWGRPLRSLAGRFLVQIATADKYDDRCHHVLDVPENSVGARLQLDYQRYFKVEAVLSTATTAMHSVEDWCTVAEAYFERFGAGDLEHGGDQRDDSTSRG